VEGEPEVDAPGVTAHPRGGGPHPATRILWARHGHNQANLTRRLSHRILDPPLTDRGRAEAQVLAARLADRLAGTPSPVVASSPLQRAQQTATVVAARLGVGILTLDDLREIDVGDLDGRGDAEAWAAYDAVLTRWRHRDHAARFPGGEDWHMLCRRLLRALITVAGEAGAGRAVVIAHGAGLRAALPGLTGADDPGGDLGTGRWAELELAAGRTPPVRLVAWASG
jgi:broad specificity phosphatase PhoE